MECVKLYVLIKNNKSKFVSIAEISIINYRYPRMELRLRNTIRYCDTLYTIRVTSTLLLWYFVHISTQVHLVSIITWRFYHVVRQTRSLIEAVITEEIITVDGIFLYIIRHRGQRTMTTKGQQKGRATRRQNYVIAIGTTPCV